MTENQTEAAGAWEPNLADRRAPDVEAMAAKLAWDRGGQTTPLASYDLDRAEEIVTGETNLRAENERLRKALAPFAAIANNYDSGCEQHSGRCPDDALAGELPDLKVGDFRAARTALTGEPRA